MAEWEKEYNLEDIDPDFIAIRSLFISGHIKKMKQLEKQSPTKVANLLNLQYNSYHEKLNNPGGFTIGHINLLAYACCLDPTVIHEIIQKEIKEVVKSSFVKFRNKK